MTAKIIVNKFGGGILKKELIPVIIKRLKEQIKNGNYPIVVVSAMPGITDNLVFFLSKLKECSNKKDEANFLINDYIKKLENIHNEIITNIGFNNRQQVDIGLGKLLSNLKIDLKASLSSNILEDRIVSYGEKLSATILSCYFNSLCLPSVKLFAEEIPIITDNNFKNSNIIYELSEKNLKQKLSKIKEIPVITGFTGITKNGETTTLGRGGTDTTACFVGAAVRANKIILWKDVGGVLSADPKIIRKAKTIPFINYFEAEEAGKIIHDKAIPYVKMFKTPIEIVSIANPKLKTKIGEIKKMQKGAKIVSIKNNLDFILITDENIKLNDLLIIVSEIFRKYKVEMTLISNTRYSLQIVADNKNNQLDKVFEELKTKVEKIDVTNASMIFLVGWFDAKDVSNFNDLLVKQNANLLISAFYYEDCYRMEAVINTKDINEVVKSVYKKFIN